MIRRLLSSIILVTYLSSCASIPHTNLVNLQPTSRSQLAEATPQLLEERTPDLEHISSKIEEFRYRLLKGSPLTQEDWQLHDQLLQAYIDLKNYDGGNTVVVPARSRKKLHLQTFCLNPNVASPVLGENFVWKTDLTQIPYLRQVIAYAVSHPEISQSRTQELIWNLKKGTKWQSYPPDMQAILLEIDPQAGLKLSGIKEEISEKAKNFAIEKLKEWGFCQQGEKLVSQLKHEYADIARIQRDLEQLESKFPIGLPEGPSAIPFTPLYADTHTYGYSSHDVTFYNPTDAPVFLGLRELLHAVKTSRRSAHGFKERGPFSKSEGPGYSGA